METKNLPDGENLTKLMESLCPTKSWKLFS